MRKSSNEIENKSMGLTVPNHSSRKQSLIDPSLIPVSVRKNLIGLHQKSMLNLSHKQSSNAINEESYTRPPSIITPTNQTNSRLSAHYFGTKNNLLKKYSRNQASLYDLTKTSLRV